MCSCRSYCSLCIGMLCGKTAVTEVSQDDVFIVLFSKQYQLVGFIVSANNYCLLHC